MQGAWTATLWKFGQRIPAEESDCLASLPGWVQCAVQAAPTSSGILLHPHCRSLPIIKAHRDGQTGPDMGVKPEWRRGLQTPTKCKVEPQIEQWKSQTGKAAPQSAKPTLTSCEGPLGGTGCSRRLPPPAHHTPLCVPHSWQPPPWRPAVATAGRDWEY